MTVEPQVAPEPPKDPDPGPDWKVVVLIALTLVSIAAIVFVAMTGHASAAKEIVGTWAASCTVLAVIWKR